MYWNISDLIRSLQMYVYHIVIMAWTCVMEQQALLSPFIVPCTYHFHIPYLYHSFITKPIPSHSKYFPKHFMFPSKRNSIRSYCFFPIGSNLHQNLQCFFNPKSQQLSLELWLQTHSSLVNLPPPPQRTPLGSKGLIRRLVYGKLMVFIRVIS